MKQYFLNKNIHENQIHMKRKEICRIIAEEIHNNQLVVVKNKTIIDSSMVGYYEIQSLPQYRKIHL